MMEKNTKKVSWLWIAMICIYLAPSSPAFALGEQVAISDQIIAFQAIDAGDTRRLQTYIDFHRSLLQAYVNGQPAQIELGFRDAVGNTPLMRASMQHNFQIVLQVMGQGVDINAINNSGESALTISYVYGNYRTTQYLLAHGAIDNYSIRELLPQQIQAKKSSAAFKDKAELIVGGLAIVGAVGGLAALGAGGGGGGGGSSSSSGGSTPTTGSGVHPAALDPASFDTTEGENQEGILAMKDQYALAHGYDGSIYSRALDGTLLSSTPVGFVKVAVMDSGVFLTHPDLNPNLLSGSVTCDGTGCTSGGSDNFGHGTEVAGIISATQNGTGIYGVAPNSKFISIKVLDNTGAFSTLNEPDVAGIQYAVANGVQVINSSFGLVGNIFNYSPTQTAAILDASHAGSTLVAQYQNLVNHHLIEVFAAGNNGASDPTLNAALPYYFQGASAPSGLSQPNYDLVNPSHLDFSKNWVSVVSLDSSNTLSSFSQACGVAKNWCLAAPGEITTSTQIGGGYTSPIQGTSFAAPNVTGAIAVMLGAFPQLTPEQVLQILFDTATDLGASGVDAIYGHGLVNLQKASDPTLGGWSLVTGAAASFAFDTSGLGLSAAFGDSLATTAIALQFLDGYGKNYTIPFSGVSQTLMPRRTSFDKLTAMGAPQFDNQMNLGENNSLSFSMGTDQPNEAAPVQQKMASFSYNSTMPMGKDTATMALNYKTDLARSMDGTKQTITQAYHDPYLSLVDLTNSSVFGYSSGHSRVTGAAYYGDSGDEYYYRFNTNKNVKGIYESYAYARGRTQLSLNSGMLQEQSGILGSEVSGAFAVDKATTYHGGVAASYAITPRLLVLGNYNMGMTHVQLPQASLFNSFDTITTNSFAAGIELNKISNDNDKLGFVVSQPLRVTSGRAGLTLPSGISSSGSMLYSNATLNLAPTGREQDIETYYNVADVGSSQLSLDATYRMQPDNNRFADNELVLLSKYSLGF